MRAALSTLSALLVVAVSAAGYAAEQPDFHDGFEDGLKNWHPHEAKIGIVQDSCAEGKQCVRIERENTRGYTYISRTLRVPAPGSLRIEAKIRADNVTPGAKNFHRGKFIAVLIENGKEVDWPNADFEGTISEWVPRVIMVPDLDPSIDVNVRIGLQNAKGVVYVDDVKAFFTPRH